MDTLLNRYRNITVLLLVIFAQLVLLAYQVKNDKDVRLIRVWAVTAVTPLARAIEELSAAAPTGSCRTMSCCATRARKTGACASELGKLKLENQFLRTELSDGRPRQSTGRV